MQFILNQFENFYQNLLYDITNGTFFGALSDLLGSDRTFFYETIIEGKKYRDILETVVTEKLKEFAAGTKTQEEKERIKTELGEAIKGVETKKNS